MKVLIRLHEVRFTRLYIAYEYLLAHGTYVTL